MSALGEQGMLSGLGWFNEQGGMSGKDGAEWEVWSRLASVELSGQGGALFAGWHWEG